MWKRIEIDDLPAWFYWQRGVFELLRENFTHIAAIFFEYCKRGAIGAKGMSESFQMSSREFVSFCKEIKIPLNVAEINDTFRRVDRGDGKISEKGPKKKAAEAKEEKKSQRSDKQLGLVEFNEALIRLSIKVMNVSAAGRKAVKEGKAAEGLRRLLTNYVLVGSVNAEMERLRRDVESLEVSAHTCNGDM